MVFGWALDLSRGSRGAGVGEARDVGVRVDGDRGAGEREFFIDNSLVRVHFIIVMVRWTGLAPWEFEFPFPGSLTSTFLVGRWTLEG